MASKNRFPFQNKENVILNRILGVKEYRNVCEFINKYKGLSIECEMDLKDSFCNIHPLTLRAILERQILNNLRSNHWNYKSKADDYLSKYLKRAAKNPLDSSVLLKLAVDEGICPATLCRLLLERIYKIDDKKRLSQILRFPHLIEDEFLSANVVQCLGSDSHNGPLVDLKRRILGEEYEFKLKKMATEAGLHFDDENKLRLQGYDKTPDIKMMLPFQYKGRAINWIESKASFGDVNSHKKNLGQQLTSYCNRFGVGIIIYWFGYHVDTPILPQNSMGIIVLDDFPAQTDIKVLDISENLKFRDIQITKET